MTYDVVVIGGGPAGMIAAGTAAARGRRTLLLERNEKLGKKLFLTGKGRCNVTNTAPMEEFIAQTIRNGKFLHAAFRAFTNEDLMRLLEEHGLRLVTERGGRVFPESGAAYTVTEALERYLKAHGVVRRLGARVKSVRPRPGGMETLIEQDERILSESVLVATGGASYPSTGSTGDGYRLAQALGHTIISPEPSLAPLRVAEPWVNRLRKLVLRNVRLTAFVAGKRAHSEFGEMTFLPESVSGPIVLTLSALLRGAFKKGKAVELSLDLKPALDPATLDKRLQRDFEKYARKEFRNALDDLLPKQLIPLIVELSQIPPGSRVGQLTKAERKSLGALLKDLRLRVTGPGSMEEAIITAGGVHTKELNPSTMESKQAPGLFFAGEVIDVDAMTGGFNLQIAFSTGWLAGRHL